MNPSRPVSALNDGAKGNGKCLNCPCFRCVAPIDTQRQAGMGSQCFWLYGHGIALSDEAQT